jgi:hypothetical protein
MLNALKDPAVWRQFQAHKLSGGHMNRNTAAALEELISTGRFVPVAEKICKGEPFPPPRKSEISKLHSDKKRIVYTYPEVENWVLKLLTYLLQRSYDGIFADNLYSFRPCRGVHDAVRKLTQHPPIQKQWCYKADIRNYFNSVPVQQILPLLKNTLAEQPAVYTFLEALLINPLVEDCGQLIEEEKGIMAGTPISAFLANLYLAHVDRYFADQGILYARYSDDIILFHESKEALDQAVAQLHRFLEEAGLCIHPDKQSYTAPGEMWTFLGICYRNGIVDVAPASVEKLKAKMRRKTRSLIRWKARKGATGIQAAKAFIRVFNRKLFENTAEHELTWTLWYFPVINTTASLQIIDNYCQSCIRYLATGKHTKGAYQFRYEQIKELGYISLVNRYYKSP